MKATEEFKQLLLNEGWIQGTKLDFRIEREGEKLIFTLGLEGKVFFVVGEAYVGDGDTVTLNRFVSTDISLD